MPAHGQQKRGSGSERPGVAPGGKREAVAPDARGPDARVGSPAMRGSGAWAADIVEREATGKPLVILGHQAGDGPVIEAFFDGPENPPPSACA